MAKEKSTDIYVCSKMACDNAYTTWIAGGKSQNDMPRKNRQVLIKGGAGVIDKQLVTPKGIVTKITSEELDLVMKNCPAFSRHVKAGYLTVLEKDPSKKDVESISRDMSEDKSKQATEESVKKKK